MTIPFVPEEKSAIIFIGIPGSCKSTFYCRYFSNTHVHINLDTLHTRRNEQILLESCLLEGRSYVVDNTNPTVLIRKRYMAPAKAAGYGVYGFFFQSILAQCIERNNLREGKSKVPVKAIASISNKLQLPTLNEGYDKLFFVKIENGAFSVEDWRDIP
jgi:predicted kinase